MISKYFISLLLPPFALFASVSSEPLPGREGSKKIYSAHFGETCMFFYMSPEKANLAKQFANDVNERMLHCITKAELDCPVNEITPVATTDPNPLFYDSLGKPVYVDQQGSEIFIDHAKEVKRLAEESLGINISALSQEMSLIINYDANKFHQDQCPVQYEYLKLHSQPIPQYTIFQDLTLINWEMADQTISGTILEDSESEDSFILCFSNNELCCNVYTEPAIYLGPNQAPEYPGAATLSPHSPIPPVDYSAQMTAGSGKGKRISVAVRGLVKTSQIDALKSRSTALCVDRPTVVKNSAGRKEYSYQSNVFFREVSQDPFYCIKMDRAVRLSDIDGVEVFTSKPKHNINVVESVLREFGLSGFLNSVKVFHLIKRGEGFSYVPVQSLGLNGEYTLLILNASYLPENYRQYPIANDLTKQGIPWIQLYHFPCDRIMKVDSHAFDLLSLTPIDEILFRDGIFDIHQSSPNTVFKKFFTFLHVIAVPNNILSKQEAFGG